MHSLLSAPTSPSSPSSKPLTKMSSRSSLLLLLQFLLIAVCHAVQLSNLIGKRGSFGAYSILPFSDDTVLVSGTGSSNFKQLRLHPIVSVPNPPPRLSSTIILARIYPTNLTVIWATAITTMCIFDVDLAIDPADNVYAASTTLDTNRPFHFRTIQIIKHNPSGVRVFHKYQRLPRGKSSYTFNNNFPDFGRLSFLPPDQLVIAASVFEPRPRFKDGVPGLLVFSAKDGRFIRSQGHPDPVEVSDYQFTTLDAVRTRRGPIACYALEIRNETFRGINRMYARCTNLKSSNRLPVTRQIDIAKKTNDFYFTRTSVMEKNPPSKRQPSFFVAYERVLYPNRRRSINEIFIHRLDSDTLENVDWATGKKSASARPIIISLPEPDGGNAHTSFIQSMKYSTKARSVVLMLWMDAIKEFVPEPKGGGKITAVKRKGNTVEHRLFFLNQKRQLTTVPFSTEGWWYPDEITLNRDESCVYVFGFPLELRNFSNPLVGGGC